MRPSRRREYLQVLSDGYYPLAGLRQRQDQIRDSKEVSRMEFAVEPDEICLNRYNKKDFHQIVI
jgi:hypothetical protein